MGNPVKLNVVITIGVILVYPVVTVLVMKQLVVLLMVYQRIALIVKTNQIPVREGVRGEKCVILSLLQLISNTTSKRDDLSMRYCLTVCQLMVLI